MVIHRVAAGLVLASTFAAWAQGPATPPGPGAQAWRCGNQYTDQPCPNGRALDVADPRSAAQQAQTRQAALRDAALADKLAAQRRALEKAGAHTRAVRIGPEPVKAASKPVYRPPRRANRGRAAQLAASAAARP